MAIHRGRTDAGRSVSAAPSTADLRQRGLERGLTAVGVAPAVIAEPARSVLTIRKKSGLAGTMDFTYRNPVRSTDPFQRLPSARSLVVGALRHESEPQPTTGSAGRRVGPGNAGRIARYAWTDHYSRLAEILEDLAGELRSAGFRTQVLIDSNHLVDRHVAWRAGIGWFGKNANLLLPGAGSWFVLGSILTDAPLEADRAPRDDGCGPCRRCLADCPTEAIVAPGVVDARRCIAWLVQAGEPIPVEFRAAVGDRLYGCDVCQEVCPPNSAAPDLASAVEPRADLVWLLTANDDDVLEKYGRWYIADRDVDVIRRSALVVLGNTAEPEWGRRLVVDLLEPRFHDPNPMLRNHAVWAARRLGLELPHPRCCVPASETGGPVDGIEPGLDPAETVVPCEDPELHRELVTPVEPRFTSAAWEDR